MRPDDKRPCEKRKHQVETEGREYRREVQESETRVVWPRKEARPRLRRKKDSEDGTTTTAKHCMDVNIMFTVLSWQLSKPDP